MDISKAFDTLYHDLLIAKHHAYGFQHDALKSDSHHPKKNLLFALMRALQK